jgi:hypothetical protein
VSPRGEEKVGVVEGSSKLFRADWNGMVIKSSIVLHSSKGRPSSPVAELELQLFGAFVDVVDCEWLFDCLHSVL